MGVVIVTKKCYIIAEKINHIYVEQEELDAFSSKRRNPKWLIEIYLERAGLQNNSRNENITIRVGTQKAAYALFQEIVAQIRDQIPDQLYLDKLISNFLGGEPLNETPDSEPTKVRGIRKKKRRS
jgi:hypothetical protein